MEIVAILVVLVGGFTVLAVRRYWVGKRDAALSENAGNEWRIRSELPFDAGPPYADFGAELLLSGPSDVMEGTDEGFEVAYFTTYEGRDSHSRAEWPGAIVQVPVETPKFRFVAADLDERAPRRLQTLRQETPPHYDGGRPGRVGPAIAELLFGHPLGDRDDRAVRRVDPVARCPEPGGEPAGARDRQGSRCRCSCDAWLKTGADRLRTRLAPRALKPGRMRV